MGICDVERKSVSRELDDEYSFPTKYLRTIEG
jgi:hypothetical protein